MGTTGLAKPLIKHWIIEEEEKLKVKWLILYLANLIFKLLQKNYATSKIIVQFLHHVPRGEKYKLKNNLMKKMTFLTFISDILFFNFMAKEQCLLYLYYIPNLIHTGAF